MKTQPIDPKLIRVKVIDQQTAYADLELAPSLEIRNILYTPYKKGHPPKVHIANYGKPLLQFTAIELKRFRRQVAALPGWLITWVVEEFELRIEAELSARGQKHERRRKRREASAAAGYVSPVDTLRRGGAGSDGGNE